MVTIAVVDDSGFTQGLLQESVTVVEIPAPGPTPTEVLSGTTVGDVSAGAGDVIQVLGTVDGDAILDGGILILEDGASVTGAVLADQGTITSHGATVGGLDIGGNVTVDGTGLTIAAGLTGRSRGTVDLAAPIDAGHVDLRAGAAALNGPLTAAGGVDLRARGDDEGRGGLVVSAVVSAGDDILLRSTGDEGLVVNDPIASSGGAVRLRVAGGADLVVNDGLSAGGEIVLKGKGGGRVTPTCDLSVEAGTCILGGHRVQISGDGVVEVDAALSSATDVQLRAGADLVVDGAISAGSDVTLRSGREDLGGMTVNATVTSTAGEIRVRSGGDLTITSPVTSGGDLFLRAGCDGAGDLALDEDLTAGGAIDLRATGEGCAVLVQGAADWADSEPLTIDADHISVSGASWTGGPVWLDATGSIHVDGTWVAGDLSLFGDEVVVTGTAGDGTAVVDALSCSQSDNALAGGIVGCD